MPPRRSFKQSSAFEFRLEVEAINLRKQADGMPLSIRRDELLRKASQIDVADQVNRWLTSPVRSDMNSQRIEAASVGGLFQVCAKKIPSSQARNAGARRRLACRRLCR
jgi:hypothetical protein